MGWSGRKAPALSRYIVQVPVGSLELETATATLGTEMSAKEANHLSLEESNNIFGSEMESDPERKNEERVKVLFDTPCLVKISPSRLTISTKWRGPAAT